MRLLVASSLLLLSAQALADGPTDPPDKGGTRPEALTLPSGAGSLAGMGEALHAEPTTGALILSVPVVLPPGPVAVTPDLGLRYDSRSGNGPLGLGWSLALPAIQRRTDLGLPRYDSTDQFLWNGERLVEVAGGIYRPRVEGGFVRIVALAEGFRADLKDGTQLFLGTSLASQVSDGTRVFRWLPDHARSVHGDTASYLYAADGAQRYLTEVDYGRAGAPPARATLRYEGRADPLPDARAGYALTTASRLSEIDTFVGGEPGRGVRRVLLGYDDSTGLSRLTSAQACSFDGSVCLPALAFSWSFPTFSPSLVAIAPPGVWLGDPNTQLLDADGDGLPDVLQVTQGGATLWHNQGAQLGFAAGLPVSGAPGVNLSSASAALQDMDGDGRAELLFALGAGAEDGFAYAPLELAGGSAAAGDAVAMAAVGPAAPSGTDLRWLDLDGDGKSDALQATPDGWTAWLNQGGGVLGPAIPLTPPEPGLSFEDPTLRLADMNGDGLVDLVQLQSSSARVFLNLGFGTFAAAIVLGNAPDVGGDDTRLYLADADGDGLADILYIAPGRLSLWRNLGGLTFGPQVAIGAAPDYDPVSTTVRIADLLGTGTRGVLYSGATNGMPFLWFLDPTAGVKPNLMVGIDNGVGGQRTVSYAATGPLEANAAQAGQPFATVAPFPVQVVAETTAGDDLSPPLQESHGYRDPYWDPAERRFEGFASANVTQAGDAHVDGLVIESAFHTGRFEDLSLAGHAAIIDRRSAGGTLLARTRTTWLPITVAIAGDGEPASFAAAVQVDDEHWEGAATPKVARTRRTYDAHGNVLREEDDGWVLASGRDPEGAVITETFADQEGPWILGKLATREVRNVGGQRIAFEADFYDGESLQGLPTGQLTLGDLSRRSAWIDDTTTIDVDRYARDAYGNAITRLDGDGRRVEIDFDATAHLFPVAERQFPGAGVVIVFGLSIDPAIGAATSYVHPDGSATTYGYDGLGRLISIQRPTDLPGFPSELRSYQLMPSERSLIRERRSRADGPFDVLDTALFDGLLRPLASAEVAEDGAVAIAQRVERDARGNPALTYVDYFGQTASDTPPLGTGWTEDFRDALGRFVHRQLPAGGELAWSYAPGGSTSADALATVGEAELETRADSWRGPPDSVTRDPGGPNARTFTFQRDALGQVIRRITPAGAIAIANYDGLGRLVMLDDPDGQQIVTAWDAAGHQVARSDARGAVQTSYDGAGRIAAQQDAQGPVATYCYDDPVTCGGGSASPGRLLVVTDRSGSSTFTYDLDGRLTAETIMQQGRGLTTAFGYDSADRLEEITYPDGQALQFLLSPRGLVSAIPGVLERATYTASRWPLSRSFANGLQTAITRDIADRETAVSAVSGSAPVVEQSWVLRASGAPSELRTGEGTTFYTLDAAERLATEQGPNSMRTQTFDGDERVAGRWAVPDDPRLPGIGLAYGGAGPHALEADPRGAITYDGAGARVGEGDRALTWDAEGRLIGVQSPTADATYVYGFDGSRRTRTVRWSDGTVRQVQDFGGLAEIRDGVLWKHVFLGGERIATLLGRSF